MIQSTSQLLKCPKLKQKKIPCGGPLQTRALQKRSHSYLNGGTRPKNSSQEIEVVEEIEESAKSEEIEVSSGYLECSKCQMQYPILAGVAVVVDDVESYLFYHVKGIAQFVSDSEIPKKYRKVYLEAKSEIQTEHIEEDLEAQRVTSLYLMNHYLKTSRTRGDQSSQPPWWKPVSGAGSPLIESLILDYWDRGPFQQIESWVANLHLKQSEIHAIELGCGVGGLYSRLQNHLKSYLGVDSSFASIALARHLNLGVPYSGSIRIPGDLLQGSVSRDFVLSDERTSKEKPSKEKPRALKGDFIVGDFENPPLKEGQWDLAIALNAIDMLDDPTILPKLKFQLLKDQGTALQSCPYIWHEKVSKKLRSILPKGICDSARAVEWLYEQKGFEIQEKIDHIPWLFFKHLRQLEVYSVHLFQAQKQK